MLLSTLFKNCLDAKYIQVENSADYATVYDGGTLYIYFEASDGCEDWKNNLDFPVKPYKRMGRTAWRAHRGFLKVWKSIEEYISDDIMNTDVSKIIITGYSHGAAIALLCYEYVWYHRPDLHNSLEGYGFGCPRVIWGKVSAKTKLRFANFTVIRNLNDIVTHLPPALFGFSHVGKMLEVGEYGKYSAIDAHRPENILTELHICELEDIKEMSKRFGYIASRAID